MDATAQSNSTTKQLDLIVEDVRSNIANFDSDQLNKIADLATFELMDREVDVDQNRGYLLDDDSDDC